VHHQFGVEAIGDGDPALDAEVIDLLATFYRELGLRDYTVLLNSIGDGNCRPQYIEKLRAYYADKIDRMCADCRRRYDINPLRLLDCKNEPCQPFKAGAPRLADNLCDPCREHFETVKTLLTDLGINYELDPLLVRGLDYYTRTAFEFQPAIEGSQSAMGGGGRYDGLVEQLGGKPTPAIGFGLGIERLLLLMQELALPVPSAAPQAYAVIPDAAALPRALAALEALRAHGIRVQMHAAGKDGLGSMKAQFKRADASGARHALVFGADELAQGMVALKPLREGGAQVLRPLADPAAWADELRTA
jgi:histidyl-tRNA synthetase